MPLSLRIRPRFVLAVTGAVTVLMVGTALIELHQSREELYHLLREEAVSLLEIIDRSSANNLLATDNLEQLLAERLFNNAHYIAHLDSLGALSPRILADLARQNNLFRINIFGRHGRKVMTSHAESPDHAGLPERYSPRDILRPILGGETDRLLIGLKGARIEGGQRYAVAVRRTHPAGGAVVVNLDAEALLEFRRTIGIGRLLNDMGDNSGIVYVALQDEEGIIAATGQVEELTSVSADQVLALSLARDTTVTRVIPFHDQQVFEVIHRFQLEGSPLGIFRIGLAMDDIQAAESRMTRRMVIMSIVAILLGGFAITIIMAQQRSDLLERQVAAIRTLTGNILEHMHDAVVSVDARGHVTLFNKRAAALFSVAIADVEGHSLDEASLPPLATIRTIFEASDGLQEMTIRGADGSERVLTVSLSRTLGPDGKLESRTAVIRDFTESRRLERELQRRDRLSAMGELASGVAHEIRNPLNAIAMIAQRFASEFVPRRGAKEFRTLAGVLKSEASRLDSIVRQFLSYARPRKIQPVPTSVSDLVEHAATLVAARARERGITIQHETHDNLRISVDPEQMTQALLNVLQNAEEATPIGGIIQVSAAKSQGGVRFTITDSGEGIPASALGKVFNLYFSTKPDGNGLGLPIAQQIVAQHGGTMDIRSAEGMGTTVVIEVPVVDFPR